MGVLPQGLEIIFELQRKKRNEKITRGKKMLFNLQNTIFFSLDLSYVQISQLSYFFSF
jgi:hypothetical protein